MGDHPRIVLIGPMAVGKSAVGRSLAQLSGVPFADTDRMIVDRHGRIDAIFAAQGESTFRRLEAEIVQEALESERVVVSVGGGAVLDPGTQELFRHVAVVFLDTDLASIRPRIGHDTGRPLLLGRPEDRWQQLYDERRPLYEALATETLDTRGKSVRACVDEIVRVFDLPTPGRGKRSDGIDATTQATPAAQVGAPTLEIPTTSTTSTRPINESVTTPHD